MFNSRRWARIARDAQGVVFEGSRLAEAFGQVAQDTKAVSAYFGEVDDAYGKCGYTYGEVDECMVPTLESILGTNVPVSTANQSTVRSTAIRFRPTELLLLGG